MKAAAVFWTPLQMMHTINFVMQSPHAAGGQVDAYIPKSQAMTKFYEPLKALGLFRRVFFVKDYLPNYTKAYDRERFAELLSPKRALKKRVLGPQLPELFDYSLLISGDWNLFFVSLAVTNPAAKCFLLEDGTASYFGDYRKYRTPWYDPLFAKLLRRGMLQVKISAMYVQRSSMLVNRPDYPVEQLPSVTDPVLSVLKSLFSHRETDTYRGRQIVYLSQPVSEFKQPQQHREEEVVDVLRPYAHRAILRRHPRQTHMLEGLELDESGCMWELLCGSEIGSSSVLISAFSTAMFTPKLMYDKEPALIFVYKILFGDNDKTCWYDTLIGKLQESYAAKIHIPRSLEELAAILEQLAGNM